MDIYKFFFRNNYSALPYKDITAFVGTLKNFCLLPHKMVFVSQIYPSYFSKYSGFFENHAQHLNTPQNNSATWDLQMGFNSAFKGLRIYEGIPPHWSLTLHPSVLSLCAHEDFIYTTI